MPALYSRQKLLSVLEEEDLQKTAQWLRNRPNAQANGDPRGFLAFPEGATYVKVHIGLVGFCSEEGSPGLRRLHYRIERHRQLLLQRDT